MNAHDTPRHEKAEKNTHRCTRTHTHLTPINYSLHLMSNEGKIHLPINSFILIIRTHKSKDGAASWSTLHTFTIYTLIFIYIHIYSYLHIHLVDFSLYISPVYLSIYNYIYLYVLYMSVSMYIYIHLCTNPHFSIPGKKTRKPWPRCAPNSHEIKAPGNKSAGKGVSEKGRERQKVTWP